MLPWPTSSLNMDYIQPLWVSSSIGFLQTSKDITIGPVAVLSTVAGTIVKDVHKIYPAISKPVFASALAIITGAIVCFMGLIRIGWIVEFISLAAICAFITGSAFSIAMGQIPNVLGISSHYVDSHAKTYEVVIDTLKNLNHCSLDATLGLTALLMLYLIRFFFQFAAKKSPQHQNLFFFCNTLRTVFVILLYTLISWATQRNIPDISKNSKWKILGTVPRGFRRAVVPLINTKIISAFSSKIPATVIVMLIEHISIAKSFGRINNYTINPSQELLAIGVTNLLGPFLGAYPATGSFSRTAIKSKAGVRSPFAGVFTAIVILLAIYALPTVFYWIPSAALAAVIIHAVLDLITPADTLYQFLRISPLEVFIFLAGVFVTVFSSIENGIYTTICTSAALLLYRVVKARGRFLGRVRIHSVVGDNFVRDDEKMDFQNRSLTKGQNGDATDLCIRSIFLPITKDDGTNPQIELERPYPGIFIYRFSEGYNYPNASHCLEHLVQTIFAQTRRTTAATFGRPSDRPWNNPGPKSGYEEDDIAENSHLPTLEAIILDFSSVNNVDITSVQNLIDVRNQLDRYASPDYVGWHIACINNRWTKRALASAGFGYPSPRDETGEFHRWKPIYSVTEMGGKDSAAAVAEARDNERHRSAHVEEGHQLDRNEVVGDRGNSRIAAIYGLNRLFFHVDLTSALQSAISNLEAKKAALQSSVANKEKTTYETVDEVIHL